MSKYRIVANIIRNDQSATNFVEISPPLTTESRDLFVSNEERHLLEQFRGMNQDSDLYLLQPSVFDGPIWRVNASFSQKSDTVRAIIESAANKAALVLRCGGEIVELYMYGALIEGPDVVKTEATDEQA